MKKIFIHGEHNRPSGGTKVIHQLANLFKEKGLDAYIFSLQGEVYEPDWLIKPAQVISFDEADRMWSQDDLVIGVWPDKTAVELIRKSPAKFKVFYPICNFFLKGRNIIGDKAFERSSGFTHFWAGSISNKQNLDRKYKINSHIVRAYFESEVFGRNCDVDKEQKVIALSRKGERFVRFIKFIMRGKIEIDVVGGKFTEYEFAQKLGKYKFFLHTAIGFQPNINKKIRAIGKYILTLGKINRITRVTYAGSKYDECFPLPPAEAALAGCVVVGFAKNGDLEWMNDENSFIAKDRSYIDLYRKLKMAINTPDAKLKEMNRKAKEALKKFNKENTWNEIQSFFDEIHF